MTAEAYPSHSRWRVETRDPPANEWSGGIALTNRNDAVAKLARLNATYPTWRDDVTPVERRLVRETTTYTIEETSDDPS